MIKRRSKNGKIIELYKHLGTFLSIGALFLGLAIGFYGSLGMNFFQIKVYSLVFILIGMVLFGFGIATRVKLNKLEEKKK